tara:strand:+ start:3348 stop:3629 length:282 start_codon:yes stop_codon:yes gene_type:complete
MNIIGTKKQELIEVIEHKSTFVNTVHEGAEIHSVKLIVGEMHIEVSVHNTSPNSGDILIHHLGENELTVFGKVSKKQVRSGTTLWTDINTKEE